MVKSSLLVLLLTLVTLCAPRARAQEPDREAVLRATSLELLERLEERLGRKPGPREPTELIAFARGMRARIEAGKVGFGGRDELQAGLGSVSWNWDRDTLRIDWPIERREWVGKTGVRFVAVPNTALYLLAVGLWEGWQDTRQSPTRKQLAKGEAIAVAATVVELLRPGLDSVKLVEAVRIEDHAAAWRVWRWLLGRERVQLGSPAPSDEVLRVQMIVSLVEDWELGHRQAAATRDLLRLGRRGAIGAAPTEAEVELISRRRASASAAFIATRLLATAAPRNVGSEPLKPRDDLDAFWARVEHFAHAAYVEASAEPVRAEGVRAAVYEHLLPAIQGELSDWLVSRERDYAGERAAAQREFPWARDFLAGGDPVPPEPIDPFDAAVDYAFGLQVAAVTSGLDLSACGSPDAPPRTRNLEFELSSEGAVLDVVVRATEGGPDPAMDACVIGVLRSAPWPARPEGAGRLHAVRVAPSVPGAIRVVPVLSVERRDALLGRSRPAVPPPEWAEGAGAGEGAGADEGAVNEELEAEPELAQAIFGDAPAPVDPRRTWEWRPVGEAARERRARADAWTAHLGRALLVQHEGLWRCYEQALAEDPNEAGEVPWSVQFLAGGRRLAAPHKSPVVGLTLLDCGSSALTSLDVAPPPGDEAAGGRYVTAVFHSGVVPAAPSTWLTVHSKFADPTDWGDDWVAAVARVQAELRRCPDRDGDDDHAYPARRGAEFVEVVVELPLRNGRVQPRGDELAIAHGLAEGLYLQCANDVLRLLELDAVDGVLPIPMWVAVPMAVAGTP